MPPCGTSSANHFTRKLSEKNGLHHGPYFISCFSISTAPLSVSLVTPAPDSQRVLESIKKEKGSFIAEAVQALSSQKQLQGEFVTAEALRNVIKSCYTFANELDFDVKHMNSAIS